MKPQRLEELVFAYEIATQFPDVSGAEHLDMLLIRSDIEKYKSQLPNPSFRLQAVKIINFPSALMLCAPSFSGVLMAVIGMLSSQPSGPFLLM